MRILYQTPGERERAEFLPEDDALRVNGVFYDPGRRDSNSKRVLPGWQAGGFGNSVQIAQIAKEEKEHGGKEKQGKESKA